MTIELKNHFIRLFQMALTDDDFSVLELEMLYYIAEEKGISKEELDKLFLSPISNIANIPQDINIKIGYLYDLTRIIWADGKINDDEIYTLKKYCKKFDFLDENIDDLAEFLIECVQKGVSKEEIINQLNQ